ncbi:putative E3 ubiquitin-protein ligase [Podospora fimiseda]|uniref:HECT-type E3 ubiquitin transferase n=1 Tax=Podospora fimiseda TaxID=252190 RepID=A0AAN7BS01_9PEZI|nr:putative E3 ubiquitin-protein ligase [Podospora fimiseda]
MAPWSNRVGSEQQPLYQQQQQFPPHPATNPLYHSNLNRPANANAAADANANTYLRPQTAAYGNGNSVGYGNGGNRSGGRYRSSSRTSQEHLDPLDNLQQFEFRQPNLEIDSSSDDEGFNVSRPRHTRSMSHPFPSLFSGKKKKPSPMARADDDSGSDSGGPAGPLPNMRGRQAPPSRGHRNGSSVGSRDYVAGNCMTCASLVRWPRELHVFKCTICLTINDLQPIGRDRDRDRDQRQQQDAQRQGASPDGRTGWSHDKPVSVEHTKTLISQCLTKFLEHSLKKHTKGEELGDFPGSRNPFFNSLSLSSRPQPVPGSARDQSQHRRNPSWANVVPKPISTSYPDKRPIPKFSFPLDAPGQPRSPRSPPASPGEDAKRIFRPLEDYIAACFTSFHSLNNSFMVQRSHYRQRSVVEETRRRPLENQEARREPQSATSNHTAITELDPKLLLLGDFAENGSWWTGGQEEVVPGRSASSRSHNGQPTVGPRSPRIEWSELEEWYATVIDAAKSWPDVYSNIVDEDSTLAVTPDVLRDIEAQILIGQEHAQRTLLKACETVLKRPGRLLDSPHDLRFLLIVIANPILHGGHKPYSGEFDHPDGAGSTQSSSGPFRTTGGPASGRHSGIIKRVVGLISNSSPECQNHLVHWFARYPEATFIKSKDLVAGFLAYRLNRQNEKKFEAKFDITDGLIPSMGAGRSPASLHAALGHGATTPAGSSSQNNNKKQKERPKKVVYQEDWQIKAAAKVLGLLFAANNMGYVRRGSSRPQSSGGAGGGVKTKGQILATSDFYTTLLDDSDLVADYESWERKSGANSNKFSFCQYPFLLSIGAKIRILEHEARRQMGNKAREAFFDSLMTHRNISQHLVLNVRRECLVEDSLRAVSETIGAGGEDLKKGLKISFLGEEGVDAGGLRKEWFLLLVREVFGRENGMFIYDEDSQYCYFNPNSLEPSEQFFLVGVVFGLAIYNSTILDVALPPFAFRKLLMAGSFSGNNNANNKGPAYSLDDLAEYRPRLAAGLRQLLEYDEEGVGSGGSVEDVFCLDFVVDVERYGVVERVALCPGGERRAVTSQNRREYVDLYVRYLLDTAVTRQFEPFKRGFFTVCRGNALSLFRPEEIELLVRGDGGGDGGQGIDVEGLRAVAEYEGFGIGVRGGKQEDETIKEWFWEIFGQASPKYQRKLLGFITGSDRIPAMGAASLVIKVSLLGEDCGRYPTARTCFNALSLWRYGTKERLEEMLWGAVLGSEGFGLK